MFFNKIRARNLLWILFLLFFESCGFEVIYLDNAAKDKSYDKELSAIKIRKDSGRFTQELRNAIKETINPDNLKSEPKYILILNYNKSQSGTFITYTGASGRYKVNITVSYELLDIKTGKKVGSGETIVSDDYNVDQNRYGTYVAEEYVSSNLLKVAAINIRNSLVNDMILIERAIDNDKNDSKEKDKKCDTDKLLDCPNAIMDDDGKVKDSDREYN